MVIVEEAFFLTVTEPAVDPAPWVTVAVQPYCPAFKETEELASESTVTEIDSGPEKATRTGIDDWLSTTTVPVLEPQGLESVVVGVATNSTKHAATASPEPEVGGADSREEAFHAFLPRTGCRTRHSARRSWASRPGP